MTPSSPNPQPAANGWVAAASPRNHARLPESVEATAVLQQGLDNWINEPDIAELEAAYRRHAGDRILTWQRENSGLPTGMTTPLDLNRLGLISLPDEFGLLQNLRAVDLSYNALAQPPACILALPGLSILDLSGNPLRTLPAAIGQMAGLTMLVVRRCNLQALPQEIGNLANLERLIVTHNPELTQLPASFIRLANLHTLSAGLTGLDAQHVDLRGMPNLRDVRLGRQGAQAVESARPRVDALQARVHAEQRAHTAVARLAEDQQQAAEMVGMALGPAVGVAALLAAMNESNAPLIHYALQSLKQAPPEMTPAQRQEMIYQAGLEHAAREREEELAPPVHRAAESPSSGPIDMQSGAVPVSRYPERPRQAAAAVAPQVEAQRPVAPLDNPQSVRQRVLDSWHESLHEFARQQRLPVRLELERAALQLLRQVADDPALMETCVRLTMLAGPGNVGTLGALNDMHEAAIYAQCQQPGIDEKRLIDLGADLFALAQVKEAAVAAAAPARAAGRRDEELAVTLACQSSLCSRLQALGIRAPLPTRSVDFAYTATMPGDQPHRELRLLQSLRDGLALRMSLASWDVLGRHVDAAFADDLTALRDGYNLRRERLETRSELGEGEVARDDEATEAALHEALQAARVGPGADAAADAAIERGKGPIDSGTYLRLVNNLMGELNLVTASLRQELAAKIVDRNLSANQPAAPVRATGTTGVATTPDASGPAGPAGGSGMA
ncbi:MAG: leucine-rich repeat domain-containing protein [Bdellovibrionales bacterium]|nr:leucine-rich repeat domain-containing protein [Ramlibacter sp.]